MLWNEVFYAIATNEQKMLQKKLGLIKISLLCSNFKMEVEQLDEGTTCIVRKQQIWNIPRRVKEVSGHRPMGSHHQKVAILALDDKLDVLVNLKTFLFGPKWSGFTYRISAAALDYWLLDPLKLWLYEGNDANQQGPL